LRAVGARPPFVWRRHPACALSKGLQKDGAQAGCLRHTREIDHTISLMRHSQRGFSLPELLVAMLILTLIITTSLAAFVERNRRLQQASETILAYQSLANEAEYRRRINFSDLDAAQQTFMSDTAMLAPLRPFNTVVAVTQTNGGVKVVSMSIRWKNGQRLARLNLLRANTGGSNLW